MSAIGCGAWLAIVAGIGYGITALFGMPQDAGYILGMGSVGFAVLLFAFVAWINRRTPPP